MGKYFDYSDWELETISNTIREKLSEASETIPKKIKKHCISIRYRTGEHSYSLGGDCRWMWEHDEFLSRDDASNYLSKMGFKEISGGIWIDASHQHQEYYTDKYSNIIPYHYEIVEYDIEVYEDGNNHIEYNDDEVKDLKDALYCIDKARAYIRVFDRACDDGDFGCGSFHKEVESEMHKFERDYTESLPEDYYNE